MENTKIKLLDVILGYKCNSRCMFCSIKDNMRNIEMDFNECKNKLIKYITAYKPIEVRFGGGEPTINKNLAKYISLCKKLSVRNISIQSNGFMLAYSEYLSDLVKNGLNKIRLSFRTVDSADYEKITKVKNSFYIVDKAFDNILSNKNVMVEVDLLIIKPVIGKLYEIVQYLNKKKVRGINLWALWIEEKANKNINYLGYKYCEVISEIEKVVSDFRKINFSLMYFPYCILPRRLKNKYWRPDNENCYVISPGAEFFLTNESFMNINQMMEICNVCKFNKICIGVSKNYLLYYGDLEFV